MANGVIVDTFAYFYIETFEAGIGPIAVGVYSPSGQPEKVILLIFC